jgi:hypothetical protein
MRTKDYYIHAINGEIFNFRTYYTLEEIGENVSDEEIEDELGEDAEICNENRELVAKIYLERGEFVSIDDFSDSHTSHEILKAIAEIENDERPLPIIWSDPTDEEQQKVIKIAFSKTDKNELHWGDNLYRCTNEY